ncbi:hypothetical protein [Streptomyces sp. NPDC088261]
MRRLQPEALAAEGQAVGRPDQQHRNRDQAVSEQKAGGWFSRYRT